MRTADRYTRWRDHYVYAGFIDLAAIKCCQQFADHDKHVTSHKHCSVRVKRVRPVWGDRVHRWILLQRLHLHAGQ